MTTEVDKQQSEVTQKKPRKTLYWGVKLDINAILEHELIKKSLDEKSNLIPLQYMHSTVLYVGRKEDEREISFTEHKERLCYVTVNGHGLSDFALALRVGEIKFVDDAETVPSFNLIQHVTVALAKDVKAVESIKSFDEGTIIEYEQNLVLTGTLKQFFY